MESRSKVPGQFRLAFWIGAVRIAALWFGSAAYVRADWMQVAGYAALMLDLPELLLISSVRSDTFRWEVLGSILLFMTSFLWAVAFCYLNRVGRDMRSE